MKITGAKVVSGEEKSKQEIEAKLVEEHAKTVESTTGVVTDTTSTAVVNNTTVEDLDNTSQSTVDNKIDDNIVLSYIGEKLGRNVTNFDELIEVREKEVELPEDVSAFYNYKKETGRTLKDFMELQRDYRSMDPDDVLKRYHMDTSKGLDPSDIEFEIKKKYGYDSDFDDEDDIKARQIAKKKDVANAIEYFESQKDKFKAPLESSSPIVPEEKLQKYQAYEQYEAESAKQQEEAEKRSKYFRDKTSELFSEKFEGFKFKYGDNEVAWKPNDVSNLTPESTSFDKFVSSHLDENGYLKDVEKYQRAMAIAKDPDAFANFFIEQGRSMAVNEVAKQGKNTDMNIREAGGTTGKGGTTARIVNPDGGNKLRINIKK